MTILENLYYGNICPNDRTVKTGSEYSELRKDVLRCDEKLRAMMGSEGEKLYDQILQNIYAQMDIGSRESFVDGYRLGARVMLEILTETDGQLAPLHSLA